jgi:hypothetical protein
VKAVSAAGLIMMAFMTLRHPCKDANVEHNLAIARKEVGYQDFLGRIDPVLDRIK